MINVPWIENKLAILVEEHQSVRFTRPCKTPTENVQTLEGVEIENYFEIEWPGMLYFDLANYSNF